MKVELTYWIYMNKIINLNKIGERESNLHSKRCSYGSRTRYYRPNKSANILKLNYDKHHSHFWKLAWAKKHMLNLLSNGHFRAETYLISSNGFQTTLNHQSAIFHQRDSRWAQPSYETQLPSKKYSRELPNNSQPCSIWNLSNIK